LLIDLIGKSELPFPDNRRIMRHLVIELLHLVP
jgi:hypothetical protein